MESLPNKKEERKEAIKRMPTQELEDQIKTLLAKLPDEELANPDLFVFLDQLRKDNKGEGTAKESKPLV